MTQSIGLATTKLAQDKRGNPRIWIEGRKLAAAGFVPEARYRMTIDSKRNTVTLEVDAKGDRIVSRRKRRDDILPIVDIANAKALASLPAGGTLRIDFAAGRVIIEPSATDRRRAQREARTMQRLKTGQPLRVGSVSTGLGVLAKALHTGMTDAGVQTELAFSVEIDPDYQDLCAQRNPVWRKDTRAISMPMQEFAFDPAAIANLEQVDILEAGIPCTAHSLAGRAKKHLAMPEHDPVAGHLVVGFLAIVAACSPTCVIVENVPQYRDGASFAILVNQLTEWGYDVQDMLLKGEEHGCLEHRTRMALVATSKGMSAGDLLPPVALATPVLSDILEDIPDDSPLWSEMRYLRDKEERDIEAGKGFRMQILQPDATKVGTIGRGYAKVRSTEPKLAHPTNPNLLRQFTPIEHARIKGVPEQMVSDIPVTMAHEMLGQSIVAAPFAALGQMLGAEMLRWSEGKVAKTIRPLTNLKQAVSENNDNAPAEQLALFG